MSEDKKVSPKGSDWTRLLTDPDLVSHLGKLLQTYREVAPEQREAALLLAMREIKEAAIKDREAQKSLPSLTPATPSSVTPPAPPSPPTPPAEMHHPEPVEEAEAPPFEPDLFAST